LAKAEERSVSTVLRSAIGHRSIGPSGVDAQSNSRTRRRISPSPAKNVSVAEGAGLPGAVSVDGFTVGVW